MPPPHDRNSTEQKWQPHMHLKSGAAASRCLHHSLCGILKHKYQITTLGYRFLVRKIHVLYSMLHAPENVFGDLKPVTIVHVFQLSLTLTPLTLNQSSLVEFLQLI